MKEIEVAMAIVQSQEGKFLSLEKHRDYRDRKRYAENPKETAGGKLEDDENPVEAAKREVREETGLDTEYAGPEEYPDDWSFSREQGGRKITFYPVPLRTDVGDIQLSEEHSGYFWLATEEFRKQLPEHNVKGFRIVLDQF